MNPHNAANVFETHADRHEKWFKRHPGAYRSEVAAVREVLDLVSPWGRGLEIGTGTGRFSTPFGITEGVESAAAMLQGDRRRKAIHYFNSETMNPHTVTGPAGNMLQMLLRTRGTLSSHGEIMKAALVSLPAGSGDIVLVDEPESGQDFAGVQRIRMGSEQLEASNVQVIAASHHRRKDEQKDERTESHASSSRVKMGAPSRPPIGSTEARACPRRPFDARASRGRFPLASGRPGPHSARGYLLREGAVPPAPSTHAATARRASTDIPLFTCVFPYAAYT